MAGSDTQQVIKLVVAVVVVLAVAAGLALFGFQQGRDTEVDQTAGLEVISNSIGMQLVAIPAGRFVMGEDAPGRGPAREVKVAAFYMAAHEVTQAQWQAVMGFNPSQFQDLRRPVENVTWQETQRFLEELNRIEGTNIYRLPSEAEWEYAARAGSQGRYFFGDDPARMSAYAWFDAPTRTGTQAVGRLRPNAWGLYDMYGNVWEWVQDCWHEDYRNAPTDGRVRPGGDCSLRVLRGGGWASPADYLGSTVRGSYEVRAEANNNGFRVVLSR